jgi:hypothetical protein
VAGTPGVGKTSFAVHAATALADRFPDGQLFLDLRGLDELVEYGLLQSQFTDRYRLHDLIRLFARARLSEEEAPADVTATGIRVESWPRCGPPSRDDPAELPVLGPQLLRR